MYCYKIYVHHSANRAGYLVKDVFNRVIAKGITKQYSDGYTEALLEAVLKGLKHVHNRANVTIYCPTIGSITTKGGAKRIEAKRLRAELVNKSASFNIFYERISEKDENIKAVKALVISNNNDCEQTDEEEVTTDYIIYTDGSCNNFSPFGEGGAAYIVLDCDRNIIFSKSKSLLSTTNNRAEMLAILSAVRCIPDKASITIYTDSQYCIGSFTAEHSQHNQGISNRDLIDMFDCEKGRLSEITFRWIKGHNGDYFNERVDAMAQYKTEEARLIFKLPIYNSTNCKDIDDAILQRLRKFDDWIASPSAQIYKDNVLF